MQKKKDKQLTIFKSIKDIKTSRKMRFETFDALVSLLHKLSKEVYTKPSKEGPSQKTDASLISPAVYKPGTTRKNVNVERWGGWCAIDVDDFDCSFDEAVEKFKGHRCVIYSTSSSKSGDERFRVVFDLDRSVPQEEIKHFWYALNNEFGNLADVQTKDMSRMFYTPAAYPGSDPFFIDNPGEVLAVDRLLEKWPYVSSQNLKMKRYGAEIFEKMKAARIAQCNDTNFTWTSYRDCPFVNQRHITEYRAITESGWYSKMYTIMTSIACSAIDKNYPISVSEISELCRQIDADTGGWYANRNFELESSRALEFAIENKV